MSTRVLVWGPSGMLREIIADALAREPGFEVIDAGFVDASLSDAIRSQSPDLLLTIAPGDEAGTESERFMSEFAHHSTVEVNDDGRTVVLTRLQPERLRVVDASLDTLMRTIRLTGGNPHGNSGGAGQRASRTCAKRNGAQGVEEFRMLEIGVQATADEMNSVLERLQRDGLLEREQLADGRVVYRASQESFAVLAGALRADSG